jgi:hypothetical protein
MAAIQFFHILQKYYLQKCYTISKPHYHASLYKKWCITYTSQVENYQEFKIYDVEWSVKAYDPHQLSRKYVI